MSNCSKLGKKERAFGYSVIFPYLAYTAVFWGYPFIWMVVLAFTKWNYFSKPQFVFLNNFLRIFTDSLVIRIALNTLNFLAYLIPMVLFASLLFAMALTKVKFGKTFIMLSFLVANVSSGVAYSLLFSNLFSINGPINRLVDSLFGFTIPWFSNPQLAVFSICLIITWKFIGYYGLIIYAGLLSIPQSIYEAAELDGADKKTIFWKITLPLLNPSLITVTVLAITLTFGIFTEPYMITGGGPMQRTTTFLIYMYDTAFKRIDPSYATTVAIVTALVSYALVMLIRKFFEKEVVFV
ncbi:MAG: sugar ABC transporter permease [Fervidobacterium sp.]|uniref:Carbohydrate ABC transporter membrane protein 1, CUT1 family n=1 Tax=Fervidobacterium pennivorans (strain DSM 9078 / Ven5) TaxID=771875 RepID=H9UE30_FERPD|nr:MULTISPECIES: sugar ABC transporter permease [Fervidobacterium]AFG35773.1 carbohydrate ABC transporter membrane protein 1, CUT1 family [Fervidobacterium pennivorans DSM 9078]KAF2961097.1 sugar ABC transporter permease [Fervidobacterium sp. 2310opik-2]NPU90025.1 sugar ABC transporter permease [Fervidobacterium sp.]